MGRVIVTVQRCDEAAATDVEVPTDLAAGELARLLAQGLAVDWGSCRLLAFPLGRALLPHETLADAGVWDGAWLVLQAE